MRKTKLELTWGEHQIAKDLAKKGMVKADLILKEAFPGYSLRKIRKDAGAKRGGSGGES